MKKLPKVPDDAFSFTTEILDADNQGLSFIKVRSSTGSLIARSDMCPPIVITSSGRSCQMSPIMLLYYKNWFNTSLFM